MGEESELTELEAKIVAAVTATRNGRATTSTIRIKIGMRQTLLDSTLLAQTLTGLVRRRLLAFSQMGCFRYFHLPPPPLAAAELSGAPRDDDELADPGRHERIAAASLWHQRMAGERWHDDARAIREGNKSHKDYLTPPFYNTVSREI
jgi:hypothetical protein